MNEIAWGYVRLCAAIGLGMYVLLSGVTPRGEPSSSPKGLEEGKSFIESRSLVTCTLDQTATLSVILQRYRLRLPIASFKRLNSDLKLPGTVHLGTSFPQGTELKLFIQVPRTIPLLPST